MEANKVTLKKIYRILTDTSYPKNSYSVFSGSNQKGLTLSRFWLSVLIADFKETSCGKKVFRNEGPRSRFFSQFCNRDPEIRFYGKYAAELDDIGTAQMIERQTSAFSSFFRERECDLTTLLAKTDQYLSSEEIPASIKETAKSFAASAEKDISNIAKSRLIGLVFTTLTILALYGEEINKGKRINNLRDALQITFTYLGIEQSISDSAKKGDAAVSSHRIISNTNSSLFGTSVPQNRFFGRERELFDIYEGIESRGKYLLSGDGGIGKTELLRQILHSTSLPNDYVIAALSYRSNLTITLLDGFRGVMENTSLNSTEESVSDILAYIRSFECEKLLILIDNVDKSILNDPLYEEFLGLPSTIIASSRMSKLKGFTTIKIDYIRPEDCTLIFRNFYKKRLSVDEKSQLDEVFYNPLWRNTQTIVLLSKLMKQNDWSIKVFVDKLNTQNLKSLSQIYSELYSLNALNDLQKQVLGFMARTGSIAVPYSLIRNCAVAEADSFDEALAYLIELGYLEKSSELYYYMRPFVSECLSKKISISSCELFIQRLHDIIVTYEEDIFRIIDSISENYMSCLAAFNVVTQYAQEKGCLHMSESEISTFLLAGFFFKCLEAVTSSSLTDIAKECIAKIPLSKKDYAIASFISYVYDSSTNDAYQNILKEQLGNSDISKPMLSYMLIRFLQDSLAHLSFDSDSWIIKWLEENGSEQIKNILYYYIANGYCVTNDNERALEYINKALETTTSNQIRGSILLQKAAILLRFDRGLEALDCLKEVTAYRDKYGACFAQTYYNVAAMIHRYTGDYELGIQDLSNCLVKMRQLGYEKNIEYISVLEQLAITYEKAEMFELSEETHLSAIRLLEQLNPDHFFLAQTRNNLAVLYICMNRPQDALSILSIAGRIMEPAGGVAAAELYNNYSRAYALLGDDSKAISMAEKAYPTLLEAYGPDHPKCIENRERVRQFE